MALVSTNHDTANASGDLRSRGTRLPNFLVIGAMKASTTSFYNLVTQHPQIWFPEEKEPHYFTSRDYDQPAAWERYLRLFASAPMSATVLGEASTGYSKLPHLGPTPERIRARLGGDIKLLYLLRDPVERCVSNYRHSYLVDCDGDPTPLSEAIQSDPILLAASGYARQIKAYHAEFGRDHLMVVTTDELHSSPTAVMRKVEQFLGIDPHEHWPTMIAANNSQQSLRGTLMASRLAPSGLRKWIKALLPVSVQQSLKRMVSSRHTMPPVPGEDRELIWTHLADDVGQLAEMLGDRVSGWKSVQRLENPEVYKKQGERAARP